MKITSQKIQIWKKKLSKAAAIVVERLVGAYTGAEPKERRRLPLLSAFLLLMAAVTLAGSFILRTVDLNTSYIMMGTSGLLFTTYFVNRTRFYKVATYLAMFVSAIPPITTAFLKPAEISLTAEFMWLALPLLVSSLILTVRQTFMVTLFYIAFIIILASLGFFGYETTAPTIAFLITISSFVITIANIRAKDQAEIETRLKEKKKNQEALVTEATRRRILIEQSRDGIVVLDQDGNVYEANQRFAEMLGYTPKEVRKLKVYDWEFSLPKERVVEMIRTIDEKGDYFETRHRRKDGTIYDVEISSNGAVIAGQKLIFCVCRDITERKRMEQALRESQEKFSKAFQSVPQAVSITAIKNAKYVVVNDSFLSLTGYSREEVIGHSAEELELWANPDENNRVKQLIKQRDSFENEEFILQTKSKEKRIVLLTSDTIDFGGEPCILVVRNDITERKRMENSLKESEEKFSTAFHASPQQILIVRNKDDVIIDVNESILKATGYTREEVIGHDFGEFNIFANPEEYIKIAEMLNKDGRLADQEFSMRMKSGAVRQISCSAETITIKEEQCIIYVLTDITERKQMEKSIKESEEKFSKAFMNSPQAVLITSLDDGIILEANDTFVKLSGYPRKDLISKKAIELHLWNSPEERENIIKALNEKGIVKNVERRFIDRDGKLNTWLFSADKITIDNKPCMLSVTVDISAQKRVEEQLRFSDIILKSIHEGIFVMDSEFKITSWNEMCEQMFGVKASEAIGKHVRNVVSMVEKYLGQNRERINHLIEKGVRRDEQIYQTPRGDIWADVKTQAMEENGKRTGWVTLMSDITMRKRIEEALKQSEEKYRELINTSTDAIISTDHEMQITIWNHGAEKIFGYTEKEMLGQSILTIFPTDLYKDVSREIIGVKSGRNNEFNNKIFETSGSRKDCSIVPIEVSLSSRKTESSYIITTTIRDITIRKEAEKKLREIDQMKSEFLSNVSHELRTPLQSISGFTKLIMAGKVPDPATQQEFLQIIDGETKHLGNLINSLLDISRLEASRFKIYMKLNSVYDIFTDAIKMFHSLSRDKDITLTESIPPELPEMEVDSERMRQVVINLVSNAIKFSAPGSSILVNAEVRNNELLFQVTDHGIGIRKEAMTHLFERFYRVDGDAATGGTGLGLYISKQIIDAHGGKIWAESKFGEGSTFSFTLPLNNKGGKKNGKENTGNRRRSSHTKTG